MIIGVQVGPLRYTGVKEVKAMSAELLVRLQDAHAFDPAPRHAELWRHHVPFDAMTGNTRCEAALERALRRGERVALVGQSGAGKSSVTAHVLGPLVEGLAPLTVPVAIESRSVAVDPVAFAGHLVQTVARYVRHAHPAEQGRVDRIVGSRTPRRLSKVSITPQWLGASVELTAELDSASADGPARRSGQEIIEQARQILDIIAAHGLRPVLVLDDTDTWLSGMAGAEAAQIRAGFFGRITRLLAEELAHAAVLAVHENYLRTAEYSRSDGFIDTTIRLPAAPDATAIGGILGHRVGEHVRRFTIDQVIAPDALETLQTHYRRGRGRDIRRRVLYVAHTALARACDDAAETIQAVHIDVAISECAPEVAARARPRPT